MQNLQDRNCDRRLYHPDRRDGHHLHKLGHFAVAKLCGVRVESFSVGFGPRLFGVKYGDTDYKVCLLPLGGYVSR